MKNMKKYFCLFDVRFIIFVAILVGFSSCERHVFVAGNLIPEETKENIYRLNDTLLTRCFELDSNCFEKYLCAELKGTVTNYFVMMSVLVAELEKRNFRVLNDFYYQGTPNIAVPPLVIKEKFDEGYQCSFIPLKNEMFVSLVKFDNGRLLLLRYGKEKGKWQLCYLETGWLTIEGKNVYDWFRIAQSDYEQGYIWGAFREVALMEIIAHSLYDVSYLQYNEMSKLTQKVVKHLGREMQSEMDLISSKPVFLKISWFGEINRFYPRLRYRTSLPLSDTLALRKECESVHRSFWKLSENGYDGVRTTYYEICSTDDSQKVDLELVLDKGN